MSTVPLFALDAEDTTDAWYTPGWIFDGLGLTFDLDVAAPADPLPWLPAQRRYSLSDDGLAQPWDGVVWCNPPYSDPAPWCRKWADHTPGGCLLIRPDLSTRGPQRAFDAASSIYAAPKRIQFVNGHGEPSTSASFSAVLLGRGDVADAALFRLASRYGGQARHLTREDNPR